MNTQLNRNFILAAILVGVLILSAVSVINSTQNEEQDDSYRTAIVRLGDAPAANVNGTVIYDSDVRMVAQTRGLSSPDETLSPDSDVYRSVLNDLIDQRLLFLEATARGLDQQNSAKRRLAQARERILGNILVEAHIRDAITDTKIRNIYDAQSALRYERREVRARQIVVGDKTTADAVLKQLENGDDFSVLAITYSTDRASRDSGGDLGFFTDEHYGPVFTRIAFNTAVGNFAGPFQTDLGWHVIQVTDQRKAVPPSFDDIKEEIKTSMTFDEINGLVKSLRSRAEITRLSISTATGNTETGEAENADLPPDDIPEFK